VEPEVAWEARRSELGEVLITQRERRVGDTMGNGQWAMGNGQCRVQSAECGVRSWHCTVQTVRGRAKSGLCIGRLLPNAKRIIHTRQPLAPTGTNLHRATNNNNKSKMPPSQRNGDSVQFQARLVHFSGHFAGTGL